VCVSVFNVHVYVCVLTHEELPVLPPRVCMYVYVYVCMCVCVYVWLCADI